MDATEAVENFWSRVWMAPQEPEAIDELVVEDFVIVSGGQEIRSRAAFKEWVLRFQAAISDLEFHVAETFQNAEGTRVASLFEVTGRNNGVLGTEADGAPIHLTGTAVWDVREDGMLLRNRIERNAFELYQRLASS
jgi:hypothetical protein